MRVIYSIKGTDDLLEVFEDRLTITPQGFLSSLIKGFSGTKTIPFASITAIQFRKGTAWSTGYIQFTLPGGNESKGGIYEAMADENAFGFFTRDNAIVSEIKEHIEEAMRKSRTLQVPQARSISDELQKLSDLKRQGFLSEEEFQAAKRKLIE